MAGLLAGSHPIETVWCWVKDYIEEKTGPNSTCLRTAKRLGDGRVACSRDSRETGRVPLFDAGSDGSCG
jgi:hypothetical protein